MLGLSLLVDLMNNIKKDPIMGKSIKDDRIGKFINQLLKLLILLKNLKA